MARPALAVGVVAEHTRGAAELQAASQPKRLHGGSAVAVEQAWLAVLPGTACGAQEQRGSPDTGTLKAYFCLPTCACLPCGAC